MGGKQEVRMPDGTRADCETSTHIIEMDFARKWSESVGQALFYSYQSDKRGGIALILKRPKDRRFWYRLNSVINAHQLPIDTWLLNADGEQLE